MSTVTRVKYHKPEILSQEKNTTYEHSLFRVTTFPTSLTALQNKYTLYQHLKTFSITTQESLIKIL